MTKILPANGRRDSTWAREIENGFFLTQNDAFTKLPWLIKFLEFLESEKHRLLMAVMVCNFNLLRGGFTFEEQFLMHVCIVYVGLMTDTLHIIHVHSVLEKKIDKFAFVIIFYASMHMMLPVMILYGMKVRVYHVIFCSLAHLFHYLHVYMFCISHSIKSNKLTSLVIMELLEAAVNWTLFAEQYFVPLSATTLSYMIYHGAFVYTTKHVDTQENLKKILDIKASLDMGTPVNDILKDMENKTTQEGNPEASNVLKIKDEENQDSKVRVQAFA
mmetsp:Transcript_45538/g.58396  ORF Transcript_45538/g.58396 Transcript_45538/m.58396 type:complete len:273 (-) Transcript_45538:349-1167(-)